MIRGIVSASLWDCGRKVKENEKDLIPGDLKSINSCGLGTL